MPPGQGRKPLRLGVIFCDEPSGHTSPARGARILSNYTKYVFCEIIKTNLSKWVRMLAVPSELISNFNLTISDRAHRQPVADIQLIFIGFRYCVLVGDILMTCPSRRFTNGKYSASGSQMRISSFVFRNTPRIERFAEKLFPLTGVPKIMPFGVFSLLRSARIILPETALTP